MAKQLQEQQLRAAHAAKIQQAQAQHLAARQAAAQARSGLQGLAQAPPQHLQQVLSNLLYGLLARAHAVLASGPAAILFLHRASIVNGLHFIQLHRPLMLQHPVSQEF